MSVRNSSIISEDGSEHLIVTALVRKKTESGASKYQLRWHGVGDQINTWNLKDESLISNIESMFEERKAKERQKKKKTLCTCGPSVVDRNLQEPRGFNRGLEVERVLGATDLAGELQFLVKWKGSDKADLVPAREANAKCCQAVIEFYELRATFSEDVSS